MATRKPKPQAEPVTASPIAAMVARMRHLADRAHRLELCRNADAGPLVPAPEQNDIPAWEAAVWSEYFGLEDCLLRSEPASVSDALAILLFASGKMDTLVSNLQPDAGEDDSDYRAARLIEGGLESAAAYLFSRLGSPDLADAVALLRPNVAVGAHGPALAELPAEAELEARIALRRSGPAALAVATAKKGGAQ